MTEDAAATAAQLVKYEGDPSALQKQSAEMGQGVAAQDARGAQDQGSCLPPHHAEAPDMKEAALAYLRAGVAPIPCCHPDPRQGFLHDDEDGYDPAEPKYRACYEHGVHKKGKGIGKTPLEKFAKYEHDLPTETQVAAWWDQHPGANIAIVTGNQYVMFDLDNPEALREAEARGGLEDAPTQRTGHGFHFAFAAPHEELHNFAGREMKGLDGRANGGFAMAAPSLHANGKRYEWVAGSIPDFDHLPPLPSWLLDLWRNKPVATGATTPRDGERFDLGNVVTGIPEGQRNDQLYRTACSLQGRGIPYEVAELAMIGAAARCIPAIDDDTVLEMVDRVYAKYGELPPPVAFDFLGGREGGVDDAAGPTPFPVEVLPEVLATFVRESADAVVAPPEFIAVPLLVAAGSVIGRHLEISLKKTWNEGPNLFAACVGTPGSKKTPAMKMALGPLCRLQSRLAKEQRAAAAAWKVAHREWEKAKEGVKPEEPAFPHLLATDATVEALVPMLAGSPGIVLLMDELVAWVRALNQYKAGGKGADRQALLSLWARNAVKVDRRGRVNEPVMVDHPCLSVVGGIQPDLLPSLTDAAGDDGFLDRIVWAYPEPVADYWTDDDVSLEAVQAVDQLYGLAYDPGDYDDELAYEVRFAPEAQERWVRWYNARKLAAVAPNLEGVWAKLPAQLARLTMILHAVQTVRRDDPSASLCDVIAGRCSTVVAPTVSLETLESAIHLLEYFQAQARKVYGQLRPQRRGAGRGPFDMRRKKILDALAQDERISQTALLKDVFRRNIDAAELGQLLDQLREDGVIVKEAVPGHGCPPTTYWRLAEANQTAGGGSTGRIGRRSYRDKEREGESGEEDEEKTNPPLWLPTYSTNDLRPMPPLVHPPPFAPGIMSPYDADP